MATDRVLTFLRVEAHSRHALCLALSFSIVSARCMDMSVAHSSFNFREVLLPICHHCSWTFGCFQFGATVYKAAVNVFVLILGEGGLKHSSG